VVVAIIQISTLNTDVDKGSKTTGFDFGLVDPKVQVPVDICLSQRLSHACRSMNRVPQGRRVKLRKAQ